MRESVDVHTRLLDQGIPHEIYRLDRPARMLADACAALGLDPSEVVAVSVFETRGGPIVAFSPLSFEPDGQSVAEAVGSFNALRATPGSASRYTGYTAQWIPPVAHRRTMPAVADPRVLDHDIVYTAGGAPGVILKMRSDDLVKATGATIAANGLKPFEPLLPDAASEPA